MGWSMGLSMVLLSPLSAQARPDTLQLSLADAHALALRANPDLRTASLDTTIARGERRQAGLLLRFNPSGDLLAGGPGTEVGITQEIEIAGQQWARRAAAQAGVERAGAGVVNLARLIIGEVDRTFYRVVAATQRLALATEVLNLNQRLAAAAGRQLAAGEISHLELNLAMVEVGRSQARALAAKREREGALADLRRLLGQPPTVTIVTVLERAGEDAGAPTAELCAGPPLPRDLNVDSLTAVALARRPDLAGGGAAEREAAQRTTVSRREAFPNLTLRVTSELLEQTGQRALRPGVGITLPLFNRNRGEIQALLAATEQARLAREALVARIRAEVSQAAVVYEAAMAQEDALETSVLAPARENRRLLEVTYREGKIGLPVLLLVRNQVIDSELEYWDAWLTAREARVELAEVTGENCPDPQTGRYP